MDCSILQASPSWNYTNFDHLQSFVQPRDIAQLEVAAGIYSGVPSPTDDLGVSINYSGLAPSDARLIADVEQRVAAGLN